jgi:hypothetical protein
MSASGVFGGASAGGGRNLPWGAASVLIEYWPMSLAKPSFQALSQYW